MHAIEDMLRHWLEDQPEIRLAYLFGSLARGQARRDSDVDLAIDTRSPLDAARKAGMIEELTALTGRPVDLVELAGAGEPLLGQVLDGRRLKGHDAAHAALVLRHVMDAADFLPYRDRILRERRLAWTRG
ncbi:type VII toxin-antitoxin system MntA family adenylyltransferase antitoxin [Coralloluteibacterium thermophilus]|uniref:Nucleotidyltransferase family protein n=1 Tax=Coralloluteibacterium thermophilum TaxID=2707049 RepID=A0ABV9NLY3_9GAMM